MAWAELRAPLSDIRYRLESPLYYLSDSAEFAWNYRSSLQGLWHLSVTENGSCAPAQRGMGVRAMADFIFQANIAHYKQLLADETDARTIATIRKLLAEEEAKLAEWRAKQSKPNAAE